MATTKKMCTEAIETIDAEINNIYARLLKLNKQPHLNSAEIGALDLDLEFLNAKKNEWGNTRLTAPIA